MYTLKIKRHKKSPLYEEIKNLNDAKIRARVLLGTRREVRTVDILDAEGTRIISQGWVNHEKWLKATAKAAKRG